MANGKVGPPLGNKNGVRRRPWTRAIERALDEHSKGNKSALDILANKIVKAAINDMDWNAINEIANRLEGKPKQQTEITGEDGDAIKVELIDSAAASARLKIAKLIAQALASKSD